MAEVVEAEADVSKNRESCNSVDGDGSQKVGVGGGGGDGR